MRFLGIALLASAVVSACGGGEQSKTTDSPAATPPAATTPPAGGTATKAPITGKTVEVKMVQVPTGYEFDPKQITINVGDGVKFIGVSGNPHNVAFTASEVPEAARAQLNANFDPPTQSELSGTFLMTANDAQTVSFANIPPGTYTAKCTPHMNVNMIMTITVK
jgi:plastocyanin